MSAQEGDVVPRPGDETGLDAPTVAPGVTESVRRTRRLRSVGLWSGYVLAAVTVLLVVENSAPASPSGGSSTPSSATASATGNSPGTTYPGTTSAAGPPTASGRWTNVFDDEFDGPTIDRSKWRVNRYGGPGDDGAFNPGDEGAFYSPDNVGSADGSAFLEIRPESKTIDDNAYTYSSGMLSSQGHFDLQDGDFVEARVRIPSGDGLWPAFWAEPEDRWPPEIDIFEMFDTGKKQPLFCIYHFPGTQGVNGELSVKNCGEPAVDYRDSWHTFGMWRSAGKIVFYVDGVSYPAGTVSAGADSLPQYLILNLAMYKGRTPAPGTRMLVDWVHVWRPS